MSGLRIVVVGINFAPESTGIGPYTTDLCQKLTEAGALVQVITGVPHYPTWSVPTRYRRSLLTRECYGKVRVTRARHYVPRSQSPLRRAAFEASFAASSLYAARRLEADVVLAVTPNLGALPVAAAVARRNRAALGAIVQDLMGRAAGQSGIEGSPAWAAVAGRLEARWLRAADSVGVISLAFMAPLIAAGLEESRLVHLPNYTHITPDPRDQIDSRRALGWPVEGFYIVHTGNMGLKQDLDNVLSAARLAEKTDPSMRFVLVGDGSQRRRLQKAGAGLRLLSFCAPLDDAQYPTALAAADVLLVNERASMTDMSLPSKLTSYFVAGRPTIAACSADGATGREVHQSGGGIVVEPGNPVALLEGLRLLASDGSLRRTLSAAAREYAASTLSSASAEQRILDFVGALASQRPATSAGS